MERYYWRATGLGVLIILLAVVWLLWFQSTPAPDILTPPGADVADVTIELPPPVRKGHITLEEALSQRRSIRNYAARPLTIEEIGQLLWAAQGISGPGGKRTAPSAGALYPLEIYCVVGEVEGVPAGVYRYLPGSHQLVRTVAGDLRHALYRAAQNQSPVKDAPISLVFTGVYARTTAKYGARGERYVHLEAGHASQNVYLQAEGLDLGTVAIGAFLDDEVREILRVGGEETPLYIMPVGAV